jgi:Predicted metal-binding integral membrane protein
MLVSAWKRVSYLRVANPHWFILVISAFLWAFYFWQQLSLVGAHHHQHAHHSEHADGVSSLLNIMFAWMLMVYAMMLPMTSGTIRAIVNRIPISRKLRSLVLFIVGYSLVWLVFGLVLQSFSEALYNSQFIMTLRNIPSAAIAYVLAALLSNARFRMRLLNACGGIWAPRIIGFKADMDVFKIGFHEGIKCVQTCAHIMIAMQIAGHSVIQMAILTVALFYEKLIYRNKKIY